ncbi:MAG: chromosome partitioning protein [Acidobacteria bacterium]|nr:MAG: chromosome partitioning protein [Acidobacteriota bacterium]
MARKPRSRRPRQVQNVATRPAGARAPAVRLGRGGPSAYTPPQTAAPGPPVIVAIANQKGGVGKTTTAINLAAALALRGRRTLLIDLDPQANSTLSFLDMVAVKRSVYDAIADPQTTLADVILPTPVENLSIAPARIALAKLEARLVGEMDAHFRLKDKLDPLRATYPNVVIDCPPTLGLLTVNALVAATHLLIPIQSSYFALEGTDDLLETIEKVRARPNPALRILGVVVTMHDKRTALARDIRAQIEKVFGGTVFRTVITKSVRLEESPAYKESIFTFAPQSAGATEYYRLCEEVIDRA